MGSFRVLLGSSRSPTIYGKQVLICSNRTTIAPIRSPFLKSFLALSG